MRNEDRDNRAHNLILNRKDILEPAVVVLCPPVSTGHGVDQLRGDARTIVASPHAALEHVANAQFAPDPSDNDRFALILEA
jgi:hypothetical protein